MDLQGQTIGQYQLIELIHQGENTVYKGFQPSMNRYVAVKILSPAQAGNPAFVQQFRQDMQLMVTLEHPNILPVYDYGRQNELLYLVTPFVEGGALPARLPQFVSLQPARQLVQSIARALDFIHSRGTIHGNLKPSNILIDEQEQPLLADFGYTQGIDVGDRESVYLPPELAQGGPLDARADVYALGVLLYEMLIGQPPPLGVVPNPRLQRPDLPEAVEKVILKAMAQNPDLRFQTATEFSHALNMALPAQVAYVSPPTPAPMAAAEPPDGRQPMWLIGGSVVAVLALLACLFFFFFLGTGGSDPEIVPTPPSTTGDLPQPVISAPSQSIVGQPVTFDGSQSQPGSSPIAGHAWDFGDGNTARGPVVNHTYSNAGTYQVALTVTGEDGLDNTATVEIGIRVVEAPAPSTPPQAVINFPTAVRVGEQAAFDGSQSIPGSSAIVSYEWDFGDGQTASGSRATHVYNDPGTYQVSLTVSAQDGLDNSSRVGIEVVEVEEPETPTPEPEPTPTIPELPQPVINYPVEGVVGEPITFDGSESQPGSNPIASYEWDFGDGSRGSGPIVEHTYSEPGTYQVTLTVTDDVGFGNVGGPVQITIGEADQPEATPLPTAE